MAAGGNLAGTGEDLDLLNTMYTEFRMLRDQPAVCRKLATSMTLPEGSGSTKNILNYERFVAEELQYGGDITRSQSLADANTSYQPNEVGLKCLIPKLTLRRAPDRGLMGKIAKMMENAYRLKEDADGCAQFSSWTPIVGSAGTIASPGLIGAAAARLDIGNNRSNPEPFGQGRKVGVLHPLSMYHVAMRMVPLTDVPVGTTAYSGVAAGATVGPGRGGMADDILKNGPSVVRNVQGVDIYRDANIAVDSNDDCSGAVFDPEGYVFVSELEADLTQKTEDPSVRSYEIVGNGSYTFGLWRPGASGVEVFVDASLPTA